MQSAILQKINQIRGVSSANISTSITIDGGNGNDPIFAEDRTYSESQIPPRATAHCSGVMPATLNVGARSVLCRRFNSQESF
jgi:hypothetical protein